MDGTKNSIPQVTTAWPQPEPQVKLLFNKIELQLKFEVRNPQNPTLAGTADRNKLLVPCPFLVLADSSWIQQAILCSLEMKVHSSALNMGQN